MATNIWGTTVDWSSRPSQIAVTSLWAGRFTSNLAGRPPVQPVCVHVVIKNGNINVCRKETLGRESLHAVVMLIKGQGVEWDTKHGLRYVRPSVCQSFILVAIYCIPMFLFFFFIFRNWKNGDDERFGQSDGHSMRRLQLLRSTRLHGHGQILQRLGQVNLDNPMTSRTLPSNQSVDGFKWWFRDEMTAPRQ